MLPVGVALPLWEAIVQCREAPRSSWPQAAYDIIGRSCDCYVMLCIMWTHCTYRSCRHGQDSERGWCSVPKDGGKPATVVALAV